MSASQAARLRILHLTAPAFVGGLERVVLALAIGHQRRGHDVHVAVVLAPEERDHSFLARLAEGGVTTHPLVQPVRAYWREWRGVAALCREIEPDVAHSHSVRTDVVSAHAAARAGCPTVTTVHGPSLMGGKTRLYEWLQRASYGRFDAVVSVSRHLADQLRCEGLPENRSWEIPNAWESWEKPVERAEARRQLGLDASGVVIGWAGRMIPVKSPGLLLQALARRTTGNETVVMIGDGPERPGTERLAAKLGLADRVRFPGAMQDAGRLFSAFDTFVLTSESEGAPIVLFEAMGAGVPIVATRVGGVPEMLTEQEAMLVDPDDPSALAAALDTLFANRSSAHERAQRARQRLEHRYSLPPWLDRYESVYRRVIAQPDES